MKRPTLRAIALAGIGTLAIASSAHAQSVIHVDADASPGGDGRSWATAFDDLDAGLSVAATHVGIFGLATVWVAEGTYVPSQGVGRGKTFSVPNHVGLYGGFDGSETDFADRAELFSTTILDGDLVGAGSPTDFAYRVVSTGGSGEISDLVRIDGFTIVNGNANGLDTPSRSGAGIGCSDGNLDLFNVTVRDCSAEENGGGMSFAFGALRIYGCDFTECGALDQGGGVWINGLANASINTGGTVHTDGMGPDGFGGNGGGGGGGDNGPVIPEETSWIFNSRFENNRAGNLVTGPEGGGGIWVQYLGDGNLEVFNCLFFDNEILGSGSALRVPGGTGFRMGNCTLWNNRSYGTNNPIGGGALHVASVSSPDPSDDGAVYNSVFLGNAGTYVTGGIPHTTSRPLSGIGTEGDGGSPNQAIDVIHCNIDSLTAAIPPMPTIYPGEDNINANPLFTDASNGDFTLQAGSPCIDAGDDNHLTLDYPDLDGDLDQLGEPASRDFRRTLTNPREQNIASVPDTGDDQDPPLGNGRVCDIGAYEKPVGS